VTVTLTFDHLTLTLSHILRFILPTRIPKGASYDYPFLRLKTHGVEDRRRFSTPIFGVENRRWFSESKIGVVFTWHTFRKSVPIFDSESRRLLSTPCVFSLSYGWFDLIAFSLHVVGHFECAVSRDITIAKTVHIFESPDLNLSNTLCHVQNKVCQFFGPPCIPPSRNFFW